ncbi:MAG: hypothetical protein WC942_11065 [Clostridia bacterium]|jgi:hypothetical protein
MDFEQQKQISLDNLNAELARIELEKDTIIQNKIIDLELHKTKIHNQSFIDGYDKKINELKNNPEIYINYLKTNIEQSIINLQRLGIDNI